jgi:hypothetical protein
MFCHIGLEVAITKVSSHVICQSYCNMYHWHECGTLMMVLWYISTVLCEVFSIKPIMTDGKTEEDPLRGLDARQV